MIASQAVLRIARPTDRLEHVSAMYCAGLGFQRLGAFRDHQGFDGEILGLPKQGYHLEFTHHQGTLVGQAPTQDNLLVFYVADQLQWQQACQQMLEAGFLLVSAYNPYWDVNGKTFEDCDGYRVVLQQGSWDR